MQIYLASFFDTRKRLMPYVEQLEKMGNKITSRWLNEPVLSSYKGATEDYLLGCAIVDIEDIRNSEGLIIDTIDETPRGGREVELGLALAVGLPVFLVGPYRNVFHRLATRQFNTWDACIEFFLQMQRQLRYGN